MLCLVAKECVDGVGVGVRRVATRPTFFTCISSRSVCERRVATELCESVCWCACSCCLRKARSGDVGEGLEYAGPRRAVDDTYRVFEGVAGDALALLAERVLSGRGLLMVLLVLLGKSTC